MCFVMPPTLLLFGGGVYWEVVVGVVLFGVVRVLGVVVDPRHQFPQCDVRIALVQHELPVLAFALLLLVERLKLAHTL